MPKESVSLPPPLAIAVKPPSHSIDCPVPYSPINTGRSAKVDLPTVMTLRRELDKARRARDKHLREEMAFEAKLAKANQHIGVLMSALERSRGHTAEAHRRMGVISSERSLLMDTLSQVSTRLEELLDRYSSLSAQNKALADVSQQVLSKFAEVLAKVKSRVTDRVLMKAWESGLEMLGDSHISETLKAQASKMVAMANQKSDAAMADDPLIKEIRQLQYELTLCLSEPRDAGGAAAEWPPQTAAPSEPQRLATVAEPKPRRPGYPLQNVPVQGDPETYIKRLRDSRP